MSTKPVADAYSTGGSSPPGPHSPSIAPPPFPARKRGKRMSRRKGQNPEVRIGKRANGEKYFFFQHWIDVPSGRKKASD